MNNDIPPRDFGKLEATVTLLEERLEKTVEHFEGRMEHLTIAVDKLTDALNQARGGGRVLAAVASASAVLTTLILKIAGVFGG